ncbi:hypothetical protein [Actinoplanes sp. L3-i22]|uniref:hypothetical protein n=1 Tax=Actinoplanes sp. L3-i22 TaxID=2836373 RepID=UPI001C7818C9|nr:hypothetical protein [Actinoplanes sp. L3-i22]BCY11009.1 hypothetical protein L3i22_060970 [Actinoplanes sp. L3-i22]
MTRNRRRKTAIRARQAETGTPYLVARRQLAEPASAAPASAIKPPAGVEILPPLASWTRPHDCRWWAETTAAHGPLMAVTISGADRWWELDDLAREVAGAIQDRPAQERGLWTNHGRYYVTKREHLAGIAAALDAAGALPRLTVRAVPDASRCEHTSCRRRRGEPPVQGTAIRRPATPPSVVFGPMPSLTEVMEQHPLLTYFGFGVSWRRGQTAEERRAELADGRTMLARYEDSVREIADWLRDNVTPIKTPTVGSYGMKHVVENTIGRYVSNGELIAAALIAGYPHRHIDGPNADFGMSARDVDRLRKAARTA